MFKAQPITPARPQRGVPDKKHCLIDKFKTADSRSSFLSKITPISAYNIESFEFPVLRPNTYGE